MEFLKVPFRAVTFSHILINDLPNCLKMATFTMYADDTNIILPASDLNVLEKEMN